VGGIATLIDLGTVFVAMEFLAFPVLFGDKFGILFAATLGFSFAVVHSFILHHFWTFQVESKKYKFLFVKFLIVSLVGLCCTLFLMFGFVHILGIYYMVAKICTSAIVLVWNFLANKYWTFQVSVRRADIPEVFLKDLSVVIPSFNEANRIVPTLQKVHDFLAHQSFSSEIIVANDGSTDGTLSVLHTLQKKIDFTVVGYPKNKGKGFACTTGIYAATGKNILIMDADFSTPIEEVLPLLETLKNADIAIGSRYLHDSKIEISQPKFRIAIGRIGNSLIQFLFLKNIVDTQCGFKLFPHGIAKEIFSRQKIHRFGFDIEALAIAKSLGYSITEVPVRWVNSADSRVRPIRDALRTLFDLLFIKLNFWTGRYT